jgi:hypothetical protein
MMMMMMMLVMIITIIVMNIRVITPNHGIHNTLTRLSLASRTLAAAAVHTPIISLVNVWSLLPMWHKHTTLKSCFTFPTR